MVLRCDDCITITSALPRAAAPTATSLFETFSVASSWRQHRDSPPARALPSSRQWTANHDGSRERSDPPGTTTRASAARVPLSDEFHRHDALAAAGPAARSLLAMSEKSTSSSTPVVPIAKLPRVFGPARIDVAGSRASRSLAPLEVVALGSPSEVYRVSVKLAFLCFSTQRPRPLFGRCRTERPSRIRPRSSRGRWSARTTTHHLLGESSSSSTLPGWIESLAAHPPKDGALQYLSERARYCRSGPSRKPGAAPARVAEHVMLDLA